MSDKKSKPPFYLIDTKSEFYRPIGVRAAICISVMIWAGVELWHGDPFWSVIAVACAAYCAYVLFITYTPPESTPAVTATPAGDDEPVDDDEQDRKQ